MIRPVKKANYSPRFILFKMLEGFIFLAQSAVPDNIAENDGLDLT